MEKNFQGVITEIAYGTKRNSAAYEFQVRIIDPDVPLRSDLFAAVEIITGRKEEVLLVPKEAVVTVGDRPVVYVLKDNQAIEVSVKTGLSNEADIEIVEGLQGSETIIQSGNRYIHHGTMVNVVEGADTP